MRSACFPFALFATCLAGCAGSAPLPAKAIDLNRDGAAAIAQGDFETAEARISVALEYSPRFTEAWVNLGTIEMDRGNMEKARHDFRRARDLNPDLPAPHHALGLLAERQGHAEEAAKHYRDALKVDPGFAPARINLARTLFARGDLDGAREQFLRTTEVAPGFADGWTGLCETLLRLGREDDAEQTLSAARARFGRSPAVELLEARLLVRRGAYARAEERLAEIARRPDPGQASAALSWIAVARLGRGDAEAAAEAAERAIALNPTDGVALYALRTAQSAAHPGSLQGKDR
jgi:tetratricopeptide (TPR) repeat protein